MTVTPTTVEHLDAVVVGAGFSGIAALHRMRNQGLKTKIFESADALGGVWQYNRYPGARVDSELPFYQLSIPELYKSFEWSCRYPDGAEIRRYMEHVDRILNISKDVYFDAPVVGAEYNSQEGFWHVASGKGHRVTCKYLILCTGILSRVNRPVFPGLENYRGEVYHSALWPTDFDARGKKLAIIGAGATGIQLVQELSQQASGLDVYMRSPSYCLPLGQKHVKHDQDLLKNFYPQLFQASRKSPTGFASNRQPGSIFEVSEEKREALYEELWQKGGFHYLSQNFGEMLVDPEANRIAYNFWRKKTAARISTPYKRDLLAPEIPPFYFGTKRSPLETNFYDVVDQSNVELISLPDTPIQSFTASGITTADGKERKYDAVILATGFDAFTGALNRMGLKNREGVDIKDAWANGITTYLGLTIPGFPNAFIIYGPQAPSTLSNGPTLIEAQADLVEQIIEKAELEKVKSVEPTVQGAGDWKQAIEDSTNQTLLKHTESWWTNSNVAGKKKEFLTYLGGIETYEALCKAKIADWQGFTVTHSSEDDNEKVAAAHSPVDIVTQHTTIV
ncbi:cyclopentanone -monooxygenase [Stagonosporopsis vannaccii]|nr:cyclopentanone -monooxygenase [Stagonosporopsis vannaccii]